MGRSYFKTKNKIANMINTLTSKNFFIDKFLVIALFLTIQFNDFLVRILTVGFVVSLKPFFSNIIIVCVSMIFLILIPKKWQSRVIWFFICFSSLLAMANYSYYSYFGRFLTLGQIQQTTQLGDVKESIYQVLSIKMLVFLIFPIFCYVIYHKIYRKIDLAPIHNRRSGLIGICIAIIITSLLNLSLVTGADVSRVFKLWNRELVVSTFGIYTYQFSDAYKVISNKYFVDIESENDARVDFDNFFTDEKMTLKPNEYTGILKGRDVYYIHYESAQSFLVDKTINGQEVLPTFNRLSREGIYFNNIQSQESYGTSSDSEFTVSTSTLPLFDGTVFVTHANKDYMTTERLLNDSGYLVQSFHGNKSSFWNRDLMLPRMGYDNVFGIDDYEYIEEDIIGPWGLGDTAFYKKTIEKITEIKRLNPEQPIFSKLITLTNHHTFAPGAEYSSLNLGNFNEVNAEMSNYIKSYNYVDSTLQLFFDEMDSAGLLDNAVVVIYGDHNAPLPKDSYLDYVNYNFEQDQVITKEDPGYQTLDASQIRDYKSVPFLIWTKDKVLPNVVEENIGGLIDVSPTVNNLLGIHNPYQLGNDMLSGSSSIVVYPNGSFKTNDFYYDSSKDISFGRKLTEDEFKELLDYASTLVNISRNNIYYEFIDFNNPHIVRYQD